MSNVVQDTLAGSRENRQVFNPAALEQKFGTFSISQLKRADLLGIVEKIVNYIPLAHQDAYSISSASLPMLAKLVEIQLKVRESNLDQNQNVRLRPVLFLPLASFLEELGPEGALARAGRFVEQVSSEISPANPLLLAIDRWHGKFARADLFFTCRKLSRHFRSPGQTAILGPSTVEIKELAALESGDIARASIIKVLAEFLDAGISAVEGGGDLEIHSLAAQHGFQLAVGSQVTLKPHSPDDSQNVPQNDSEIESLHTPAVSAASANSSLVESEIELIANLVHLRETLCQSDALGLWFPFSFNCLDRLDLESSGSPIHPLGLQLLRAVALGRLFLPEVEYIRAPLSLLGNKIAHVALAFGANDLGFGAVDTKTSEMLGLTKLSDGVQAIHEHGRFAKLDTTYPIG